MANFQTAIPKGRCKRGPGRRTWQRLRASTDARRRVRCGIALTDGADWAAAGCGQAGTQGAHRPPSHSPDLPCTASVTSFPKRREPTGPLAQYAPCLPHGWSPSEVGHGESLPHDAETRRCGGGQPEACWRPREHEQPRRSEQRLRLMPPAAQDGSGLSAGSPSATIAGTDTSPTDEPPRTSGVAQSSAFAARSAASRAITVGGSRHPCGLEGDTHERPDRP